ELSLAGQEVVKTLRCPEKPLHFLGPGKRLRVLPPGIPARHRQSPFLQIAHVRQDLFRCACLFRRLESGEGLGNVAQRLTRTIRNRSQAVPQQVSRAYRFGDGRGHNASRRNQPTALAIFELPRSRFLLTAIYLTPNSAPA